MNKFVKRSLLKKALKRYLVFAVVLWFSIVFSANLIDMTILRLGMPRLPNNPSESGYPSLLPEIPGAYRIEDANKDKLVYCEIPSGAIIDGRTFEGMNKLRRIDLPASLQELQIEWISYLPHLAEVWISTNNAKFYSEDGILYNKDKTKLIYFPIYNIRYEKGQRSENFTLPNTVEEIGELAFEGNKFLINIMLNSKLEKIGEKAFKDCMYIEEISLPDSVEEIGESAFLRCINLKEVKISPTSSLEQIGAAAFQSCSALSKINIPQGVSIIHKWTFDKCIMLKSASIPERLKEINDFAFRGCYNLHELYLPSTLREIGRRAFQDCLQLQLFFALPESTKTSWDKEWDVGLSKTPKWNQEYPA